MQSSAVKYKKDLMRRTLNLLELNLRQHNTVYDIYMIKSFALLSVEITSSLRIKHRLAVKTVQKTAR